MRITLLRPPFYNLLRASDYKLNTYPLNLCSLAAALLQKGHAVSLVDGEILKLDDLIGTGASVEHSDFVEFVLHSNVGSLDTLMHEPGHPVWRRIHDEILKTKPDVVGITCYSVSMNSVKNICANLKASVPRIPIVLGGIHPTSLPQHSLTFTQADYCVIGEGEETFPELIRALEHANTPDFSGLRGIAFRDTERRVHVTERAPYIANLDTIPPPAREFFDKSQYHGDVISTGRGCPFDCNYCASKVLWTRLVRYRSLESVVDEIELLKRKCATSFIRIIDDTFTLNRTRVLEWCSRIQERGLNTMEFSIGSRVDTLDMEVARALKRSGVTTVTLGIESASPKILSFVKKGETLESMGNAIEVLRKAGIQSHAFFMIGFPGETRQDIQMSKDFIAQYRPDYVEVNIVTPYPGTELWEFTMKGRENDLENWYLRFHHGFSSQYNAEYDINAEYESFLRFTKELSVRGEGSTLRSAQ